jgi:hypothetical protein
VFAHQRGRMHIVQNVAAQMRNLRHQRTQQFAMATRG